MTQPTKDQLIAARDDFNEAFIGLKRPEDRVNLIVKNISVIRILLDEAISKMETVEHPSNYRGLDLEGLKRDDKDANAHIEEMLRNEGWNSAIDHLAAQGRILPEGWVAVDKTIYKIFENACNTLQGRMNIFSAQKKED